MAKVEAIWIKRFKHGPMDKVQSVTVLKNRGLLNNANQSGKRQITIIEQEVWELLIKELRCKIDPSARRTNVMISGLALKESRHRILCLGNCQVRIIGETKPCERMDEALPGLTKLMWPDWRGGVYGEIVNNGIINQGDPVYFLENKIVIKY